MKKMMIYFYTIMVICFSPSPSLANSAEFTKSVMDDLKELRSEFLESADSAKDKELQDRAEQIVRSLIDPDAITKLILDGLPKKFNKDQNDRLNSIMNKLLTERLMQANMPSKAELKKVSGKLPFTVLGEIQEKNRILEGPAFITQAQTTRRRIQYDIDICYYKKGDKYMLFDVRIDGASTILDFRNQFSAVIRKKGVNHLLQVLEQKVSKIQPSS